MKHRDAYQGYGIETPATVTRKPYRYRSGGMNVYHGPQTAAHYSDKPRVAKRDNETHRANQHPRFDKALLESWQRQEESK